MSTQKCRAQSTECIAALILSSALCDLCLLMSPLEAGEQSPVFTLHGAEGIAGKGPLRQIRDDWTVRLGGEKPVLLKGDDVVCLRREGADLPRHPLGPQAILSTGDRIPLEPKSDLTLADEVLTCQPLAPLRAAGGLLLKVPQSRVAVLWLAAPAAADDPALQIRRLLQEPRPRDRVLLQNGDVIEGNVLALDRAACKVQVGKKQVAVPFARLAAIAFSTELLARALPHKPYGHMVLASGCRLSLTSAAVEGDGRRLTAKPLFGAAITVPLEQLIALTLRQGRAVYLSDLPPREYVHTPFLGASWPLVRDGSAAGREIRLYGSSYDKGLGMHGASRVTYDLGGQYDWLEALVGLDEQTGKRGRARVEVLVDGKRQDLAGNRELVAGDPPLALLIKIHGARQLQLAVQLTGQGDVQAHIDWAEASLIKSR
jgi:hypothetical protein